MSPAHGPKPKPKLNKPKLTKNLISYRLVAPGRGNGRLTGPASLNPKPVLLPVQTGVT